MQMIAKHMIHLWRAENNAQADKRLFDGLCEYRAAQATCFFSFLLICEGNSKIRISKSAKKKSHSDMKKFFWLLENFLLYKNKFCEINGSKIKNFLFFFLFPIEKKISKFLKCVIIKAALTIFAKIVVWFWDIS